MPNLMGMRITGAAEQICCDTCTAGVFVHVMETALRRTLVLLQLGASGAYGDEYELVQKLAQDGVGAASRKRKEDMGEEGGVSRGGMAKRSEHQHVVLRGRHRGLARLQHQRASGLFEGDIGAAAGWEPDATVLRVQLWRGGQQAHGMLDVPCASELNPEGGHEMVECMVFEERDIIGGA